MAFRYTDSGRQFADAPDEYAQSLRDLYEEAGSWWDVAKICNIDYRTLTRRIRQLRDAGLDPLDLQPSPFEQRAALVAKVAAG